MGRIKSNGDIAGSQEKKEKKFKCFHVNCNKFYSSMQSRSNHMKICQNPSKSPRKKAKKDGNHYLCRYCRRKYTEVSNVYRHQKYCSAALIFQGKQPVIKCIKSDFRCDICLKVFDRAGKLEIHKRTHENNIKYCNVCGKQYKQSVHYQRHIAKCLPVNATVGSDMSDLFPLVYQPSLNDDDLPSFVDIVPSFQKSQPSFSGYDEFPSFISTSAHLINAAGENSFAEESLVNINVDETLDTSNEIVPGADSDIFEKTNELLVDENASGVMSNESNTDPECDDDYVQEFSDDVIKHFSSLKKDKKFFSMLYACFGNRLLDEKMRSWLQRKLKCRKKRFNEGLFRWLNPVTYNTCRGRPPLCPDIRQMVFDVGGKFYHLCR